MKLVFPTPWSKLFITAALLRNISHLFEAGLAGSIVSLKQVKYTLTFKYYTS